GVRPRRPNHIGTAAHVLFVWLVKRLEVRAVPQHGEANMFRPLLKGRRNRVRSARMTVHDQRHRLAELLVDDVKRGEVVALTETKEVSSYVRTDRGARHRSEVRRA